MISDQELYSLTSFGDKDFDIAGRNARVYYEFYYNRRSTDYTGSPGQFFPNVPRTNPTNPFGLHGPMGRSGGFGVAPVMPRNGLYPHRDTRIEIDRYNAFRQDLEGDLSATWSYDAYLGYNHSNGSRGQLAVARRSSQGFA